MAHILHSDNGNKGPSSEKDPILESFAMKKRRILIADDHEGNRRQLQELLSGDSLQVDVAADGTAALEALVDHNYSILITDLKMPNISGMQLIEEIQQRRLPVTVIVTTGFGSVDEAVKAMRLGAYDFLTKPIEPDHLRLLVERAHPERTPQDELSSLPKHLPNRYSSHNILSHN